MKASRGRSISIFILAILVVGVIVLGIIGASTTYSIGVSTTGILVDPFSGAITGPVNGPITSFFGKAPWVNVITIPTSVWTVTLEGKPNGVFVLSQDNLEIEFDINFRYQVSPSHAIELYKKFPGQNWQDAAIIPHIRAAFRDVVARYPADQIQLVRDQIQAGVEKEITENIGNDTSLASGINVVSVQITDITLPDTFLKAIESKLAAQQAYLQSQFEAQKVVLLARGQANATIQQALGVKASQLIIANGTASSLNFIVKSLHLNQSQAAQLTQTYVFMQQLQSLCQQVAAPCQNMLLLIGGQGGQIFELPITKK